MVVASAVLAACAGESSTGAGNGRLELDVTAVQLNSVSDSVRLTGRVGGQSVSSFTVRVLAEARTVAELPVLESAALRRGVLLSGGPGTMTLEAATMGLRDTVTVTVAVPGPAIFAVRSTARGDADTTTFLGIGLDALPDGAVTVGGTPAAYLAKAASFVKIAAPPAPVTCSPAPATIPFAVAGVAVSPAAVLHAPGAQPVELGLGEWRELAPLEAACLRLPGGDREYVVAHVDDAVIDSARTGYFQPSMTKFSTSVSDRTVGGTSSLRTNAPSPATMFAGPRGAGASDVMETHETGGLPGECSDVVFTNTFRQPWCRSKPWAVGDTMIIRRPLSATQDTVRATVYAIYGGHWVFARIDGDASPALQRLQDTIAAAMPAVLTTSVPLLREAFGVTDPTTSLAAGQLLTIIGDFTHGVVGAGCCQNDGPWAVVLLGSTLANNRGRIFHLLTHEFTHAYQRRFLFDSMPPGGDRLYTGSSWSGEGGADLLAFEAVRRYGNLAWAGNLDERPLYAEPGLGSPIVDEFAAGGRLLLGYHDGSAYLRDLVFRLEAAGVPRATAFAAVTRGVTEGWYGYDLDGVKRPGLTGRLAALTGAPWDPGLSVLRYALAQGADERVVSTEMRNPFWQTVWRGFGGDHRDKQVTAGSGAAYVATEQWRMGTGVVRLAVPGAAGAFALSGSVPGLRWAVVRTR